MHPYAVFDQPEHNQCNACVGMDVCMCFRARVYVNECVCVCMSVCAPVCIRRRLCEYVCV